ncbi:hypothetical protein B0H17DRAFT_1182280 [Mycena rosella]|uniref:Uncharacterized protein n=1 Tax=Mycena rosella TaxID=1033263 RepID=A0AAD7G8X4_MYCRO|nr:hypothetical protein B0H17DRAFT_1182280 [Mycena rosella]
MLSGGGGGMGACGWKLWKRSISADLWRWRTRTRIKWTWKRATGKEEHGMVKCRTRGSGGKGSERSWYAASTAWDMYGRDPRMVLSNTHIHRPCRRDKVVAHEAAPGEGAAGRGEEPGVWRLRGHLRGERVSVWGVTEENDERNGKGEGRDIVDKGIEAMMLSSLSWRWRTKTVQRKGKVDGRDGLGYRGMAGICQVVARKRKHRPRPQSRKAPQLVHAPNPPRCRPASSHALAFLLQNAVLLEPVFVGAPGGRGSIRRRAQRSAGAEADAAPAAEPIEESPYHLKSLARSSNPAPMSSSTSTKGTARPASAAARAAACAASAAESTGGEAAGDAVAALALSALASVEAARAYGSASASSSDPPTPTAATPGGSGTPGSCRSNRTSGRTAGRPCARRPADAQRRSGAQGALLGGRVNANGNVGCDGPCSIDGVGRRRTLESRIVFVPSGSRNVAVEKAASATVAADQSRCWSWAVETQESRRRVPNRRRGIVAQVRIHRIRPMQRRHRNRRPPRPKRRGRDGGEEWNGVVVRRAERGGILGVLRQYFIIDVHTRAQTQTRTHGAQLDARRVHRSPSHGGASRTDSQGSSSELRPPNPSPQRRIPSKPRARMERAARAEEREERDRGPEVRWAAGEVERDEGKELGRKAEQRRARAVERRVVVRGWRGERWRGEKSRGADEPFCGGAARRIRRAA